ncbi:hypothetical protein [Polyangium jinanense]|uniref:Uncharacterized protein n=1 Tax=Polyangium jinanense TaxID=2829994 RepID=A0A9X3X044_9BACT|nr:hypothetical protein [Polyangium jinanense]MDC3954931.1 hypothetical protein [Polyangium jinanense]MDC3981299.1 hypothetical protein [Polyangium jinanense]
MTAATVMPNRKPTPRPTLPEVPRLPIRVLGPGKGMLVECPRRAAEVHIDRCTLCAACTGLSIRDRYLVCTLAPATREAAGNEPPGDGDAPLASEAQALRRRGCRIAWFGADLPLLEGRIEGNVDDRSAPKPP